MFEKLITNLKKSLPGSAQKNNGMEDNSDDAEELEDQDSSDDEEQSPRKASSDEEQKKKRTTMIIRVVLILVVAYFAIDEFVLKGMNSSEESVDAMLAKAPARRKRPKPVTPPSGEVAATTPTDTTATAATEITTGPRSADPSDPMNNITGEETPIENVNVLDKDSTSTPTEAQTQIETPATTEIVQSKTVDTSVDKKIDQLMDNVADSSTEVVQVPSQGEQTKKAENTTAPAENAMDSMASKIQEDVVESPPPAYDQIGRGLVYNCKDKYWACVDKPAYVACNKNMKWNKSKGNAAECAVQNIYNSEEDCGKVQKYNVSTSQPTAFCQN